MAELLETRHSIPSFGYSFFVDNESGYDFTATLTFSPTWNNSAPGFNIQVLDPEGKILYKEMLEVIDLANPTVFHGPSYGKPESDGLEPLKYPDYEEIYPTSPDSVQIEVPVPASEVGGVYQIKIVTDYQTINSEARVSSVALSLDPPLPYGWKGDTGFTDLCLKDDTKPKGGSVYFCSLPPGIISDRENNAGIKQWMQCRGLGTDSAGFNIKLFKDVVGGDDVLLKEFDMEREVNSSGNRRRTWKIHETQDEISALGRPYTITGPEHLINDPALSREVYRIDWVNLDDGDSSDSDHGDLLMLETHEATESWKRVSNVMVETENETGPAESPGLPGDFKPPNNYLRQGNTDVPLILCSDRNTAIRLNNGISYIEDEDLEVYEWDTKRITFLNSIQRAAWMKIQQARQDYKLNVFDVGLVNTQDDPYWIGRPGIDDEGENWDYGEQLQRDFKTIITDNHAAAITEYTNGNFDDSKYFSEDKLNRISNAVYRRGIFEFLPCHIYEQNMDPTSAWFGVFWNWHSNVFEDIQENGGTNPFALGNPYSSVFRYLYDSNGDLYSQWKDAEFPRLGPGSTSNIAAQLARIYSIGEENREDLGLGFLRDANPFSKHAEEPRPSVGIRNRLVLALLHQLMVFDQNGDSTYWNDDYRGGATAFATPTIIQLLDVWEDIGITDDDIFTGDDAIEVKEIIKNGIMNHLERYAGYHLCSAHNQLVHVFPIIAKASKCFNDTSIDFLMLRNIKVSDNRYNHNSPNWQESGGYCSVYSLFAIYAIAQTRAFLLKRRDYAEANDPNALNVIELSLRDLESQINDLTDYWNHTLVLEPDGSLNGARDYNSRVDSSHYGSSPRRFLEFIGSSYGTTIDIPEMSACHTLAAIAGRQYEGWCDMYRKWQHLTPDPYGVQYNFDENTGDGVGLTEKLLDVGIRLGNHNGSDGAYNKTRFRDSPWPTAFGTTPCATLASPKQATSASMANEHLTVTQTQGPFYATSGTSPDNIPDTAPPLPAHSPDSFVKIWPSFVRYNWNNMLAYTNQKNIFPDSSTRPDIGGISVKTGKYYCHIHADGWNTTNQNQDWVKRRNSNHDPEYMWGLTSSSGGGFSLFTTPQNGSVICGKRKGWFGSNQVYMKRYKRDEDLTNPDLGQEWNEAIDSDGCGYAWAEPSSDGAVAEWIAGPGGDGIIGTFTHKQHFNRNFLAQPSDFQWNFSTINPDNRTFDDLAEDGGIGYIERTYVFKEDTVDCNIKIVPKRNVVWDDIYMTLPITVKGRGYYSGDGQYVQSKDARIRNNRFNNDGDVFLEEANTGNDGTGAWKEEVFIGNDVTRVTIGNRQFSSVGTEFKFSPNSVNNVDRLVSGPGTDPLYPQKDPAGPIQNGNFFWPPSQETIDLHPQLARHGGDVNGLLTYCNGGKYQGEFGVPINWSVPAPSGYHTKDVAGKPCDDSLRVHFSDVAKNWIVDQPIEISFTVTPERDMNLAEQQSQSTERSITITNYPNLEKESGVPGDFTTGMMNGLGTEDGSNPTMDHSHVFITEDLFDNPDAFSSPVFNGEFMSGRVFGDPDGEFIQGSGTIHIFGDLRLDPAGTPNEPYVRGQLGPNIAGCSLIPELPTPFGWHMALTMLKTGENMGFPDNCDKGIHTVEPINEQIHLEIPFENQAGVKNDFWLHLHEDSNAAFVDQGVPPEFRPGSGLLSNIVIRIDFDD